MVRYAFEDLTVGTTFDSAPYILKRDELVSFAQEFDAQPFHVDEDAAKSTFFGGLVASGWQTASIAMRLISDTFILDSTSMGSPGIDELKWLLPVRAGDALTLKAQVMAARESKSRPDMGLVEFQFAIINQDGATVMTQRNWILFGRRSALVADGGR